jgi:hypothetical protein
MAKKSKKTGSGPKVKAKRQAVIYLYRVLGLQSLSVQMSPQTLGPMKVQKTECTISIRSESADPAVQRQSGGSLLAIQFSSTEEDMLVAAQLGMSLLEDFLSALALVTGSTFRATEPLQVARITEAADECDFYIFRRLPISHWGESITEEKVDLVKRILAHWDGLEDGHRLRRAALQYREAIGNLDDAAAFQEAYIGLETLEPPLAKAVGLTPGTEEVDGKCEACGHSYVRKKTSLVGVRAFVLNSLDATTAEKRRVADWKLINKLRNDLMHGLVDPENLKDRPNAALTAAMAHLHNALCTHSHADSLVADVYRLARDGQTYLLCGTYKDPKWPELHEWHTLLELEDFVWVPHAQFGWVPELKFRNNGLKDVEGFVAKLTTPFSTATTESLDFPRTERDA